MLRGKAFFPILPACFAALFLILQGWAFLPATFGFEPEKPVFLYFADPETGRLAGESRRFKPAENRAAVYSEIVNALISGPQGDLEPTLPPETQLLALYEGSDNTIFVDLSADVAEKHPGGVKSEVLSVYSIVNTLMLNSSRIRAVKILVNGHETETLAGHVDITRPLKARILLVR
ncbi:MAG: GerMN domain-containing protein [Desulfobacteraceae bacterium]|nr:GerMN domain-containing protein [Desulfobacteraceae bacterium]